MNPENTIPEPSNCEANQESFWKFLEEAEGAFDQVVPFPNDDALLYLQKLRQFQKESREVEVMVD